MKDILQVQLELYNKLSSLDYPIYDYVPDDSKMPYIKLGYMNLKDYSCKTADGIEITQYIDIFSNYKGQKQTREIMLKVMGVMDQLKRSHTNLNISLKNTEILEEKDKEQSVSGTPKNVIYHGVLIYKFKSI